MKEHCENCGSLIISEPVTSEKEITVMYGDVEADVPVLIYFCSKECEKEYYPANQLIKFYE